MSSPDPISLLIEKAHRSLEAAHTLFKKGDYDFAASRAYYAMFYMAEAALLKKNQTYSKHSGVITGFYHHFIATGDLPKALHKNLHKAYEDRTEGDYSFMDPFPKEEAKEIMENAKYFLEAVKNYFLKN